MVWGKKKKGYSYFGDNATLEGRLCFTGEVRLDGRVNGEIVAPGTLIIERTAIVAGDILAENLILSGTVYGNIKVYGQAQFSAQARVYGHVSYGLLSMEGALHEGGSHKFTPEELEAARQRCEAIMAESAQKVEQTTPDSAAVERFSSAMLSLSEERASALLSGPAEEGQAKQPPAKPALKKSSGTKPKGEGGLVIKTAKKARAPEAQPGEGDREKVKKPASDPGKTRLAKSKAAPENEAPAESNE